MCRFRSSVSIPQRAMFLEAALDVRQDARRGVDALGGDETEGGGSSACGVGLMPTREMRQKVGEGSA